MPSNALLTIDELDTAHVRGWALAPTGIGNLHVRIAGKSIGAASYGLDRPDVALAFPGMPNGSKSGFALQFPTELRVSAGATLELVAEDLQGRVLGTHSVAITRHAIPHDLNSPAFDPSIDKLTFAPLPYDVVYTLDAIDPSRYARGARWPEATIEAAVAEIVTLTRGAKQPSPLTRYVTFLKGLAARYDYIHSEYPVVATTVAEMLCIAHHLYILRSYGLRGALAEFGCFKGFSTSCLSHAIKELGLQLDTFDSFEGLPPAQGSSYNAGDFSGSIDEVRRNIAGFGAPEVVRMYQGFFSETLPKYDGSPVAIWMDVDLELSSRDVMTLLPRVAALGCVFSHEAVAEFLRDGKVIAPRGPDSVLPPIADAFSATGRAYAAKYLTGCLSCIWDPQTSLPPLSYELLSRLIEV